jgi:hypothetical protein
VIRRTGGLAAREQGVRCLMKDGARRARDMTALVLEPHLEAWAGAKDQPVQQLVAETGKRDGLHPGAPAENVDVHEGSRRQRQVQWIPSELGVLLFGRSPGPEGMSDIYLATRDKLPGSDG